MSWGRWLHGSTEEGFTLIEVIISLVVFAILASILVTAMGTSFTESSTPITRLRQTMKLHHAMENIRVKFAQDMKDIWDDPGLTTEADRKTARETALAALKTAIGTGPQDNSFGVYEVVDNKYIKFTSYSEAVGAATDEILKVSIKDPISGLVLTELLVAW